VVVYEGLHTYGGMAGRDMEAMAIGIEESVQDDHIRARIGQVRYLGELLQRLGHPHRAAGRRARDLPRREGLLSAPAADRFPAQALAAELYLDSASARWSAASSAPAATRTPVTTATRSWSSCASPSRAASTPRRTWT
jgi:tryptophanase